MPEVFQRFVEFSCEALRCQAPSFFIGHMTKSISLAVNRASGFLRHQVLIPLEWPFIRSISITGESVNNSLKYSNLLNAKIFNISTANLDLYQWAHLKITQIFSCQSWSRNCRYLANTTTIPKVGIIRWWSNLAPTCDIIKTGCQVKIILILIFGKLFGPHGTLF